MRLEERHACREYRGRGVAGSQLDEEPRPCHFCLLKILYMAQVLDLLLICWLKLSSVDDPGGVCAHGDCGGRSKDG